MSLRLWDCCSHCEGGCAGIELNGHVTPCIDGCNDGIDRIAAEQARRLRNPQDHLVPTDREQKIAEDAHLEAMYEERNGDE